MRVKDINVEGVGLHFYHKIDGKLVERSNEGSLLQLETEGQLANDEAILAITHCGAEKALLTFVVLADMTVSIQKTKLMVSSRKRGHGTHSSE